MKMFSADTEINATAETVWQILTDAPKYPEWDPSIIRIEGKIAANEKITVYSKLSAGAFKLTVLEFVPNRKMVWGSGMPFGLFKGERTFTIEQLSGGKVKFSLQEVFSGLLSTLITNSLPDLNPAFVGFAAGLKARAEQK